ncbi:imidazole glycerol phosphate synthase subunit HisH [Azonexus sp.]|uniref:imidazole glycerol phosphate synthase subunit HisH n=1 Tax=Azonexus sp. TaxID=1872668 RepID=UPI0035B33D24
MSIGVIDIGIGNLGSLRNALYSQGWDTQPVRTPDEFNEISHLILPGVGSFATAMQRLSQSRLLEAIRDFAASGRPILGICLGMQLLAEFGSEGGETEGLGLVPGRVVPLAVSDLRLPHVGWNNAHQSRKHPVLDGIRDDVDFYFVHSYRFVAADTSAVIAQTEYGETFPSIVGKSNVIGTQFHPEKSQANGLRLLDNFCIWDGTC